MRNISIWVIRVYHYLIRLSNHNLRKSKVKEDMLVYRHIRENGGWDNVRIILIKDNLEVTNMDQLLRAEDEYVSNHLSNPLCLNSCRARRTSEEYYKDNKDKIIEVVKVRRDANREAINERYNDRYNEKYRNRKLEKIKCNKCGKEVTRNSYD